MGISGRWFWAATPKEFALEVEARKERHQDEKAKMWLLAALIRQKKLPAFKAFVGVVDKPQTWQEMKAVMRAAANAQERGPSRPQRSR